VKPVRCGHKRPQRTAQQQKDAAFATPYFMQMTWLSFAAPEHFYHPKRNDRAKQGNEEAPDIKARNTLAAEHLDNEATNQRTNDTDNNITEQSLLGIIPHNHRCNPASKTSEHDPTNYSHSYPSFDLACAFIIPNS
jgi:hypothetical protein